MLIISVLLIITIPNIAKHNENINAKGCEAYVKMVQAQVEAFKMEKNKLPASLDDLVQAGYLKKDVNGCSDGSDISIQTDGTVVAVKN